MSVCGQITFQNAPLSFLDACPQSSDMMIEKFKIYLLILIYHNDTLERQVSSDCRGYVI